MTCKNYNNCCHYCALTESCDYFLDLKERRPYPAPLCPGYPDGPQKSYRPILLPGSYQSSGGGWINA